MATTKNGDGDWDYVCDVCGFTSMRWATKVLALARGEQHEREHETGELMQDMSDFTAERSS
jgi:hypothetical protein